MTVAQFWSINSPEIRIEQAAGGGKGNGKNKGGGSGGNKGRKGSGWSGRGGGGGFGRGGPGGPEVDPFWSEVTLLLGFNGLDEATSTNDESSFGRGVSFFGSAELDTAQKKWGLSSLRILAGTNYVNVLSNSNVSVANSTDITIEGWYRFPAIDRQQILSDKRGSDGKGEHSFALGTDNKLSFIAWESFNITARCFGTIEVVVDTWYHCAMTRQSGLWRMFLNGVLNDSDAEGIQPSVNSQILTIGYRFSGAKTSDLWCDDYRFTKGTARYTANFTPPTAAFIRGPV